MITPNDLALHPGFVMLQDVSDQTELTFGAMLRRLRLEAGLTQEELAERAELSERAVRHLERDDGSPRLQSVRLLADALELTDNQRERLLAAARPAVADEHIPPRRPPLARSLTPLIGRDEDIAVVRLLVDERPLVTIRGPGGVGKTRLALAVADHVQGSFQRLGFVDLAPLREAREVPGAIAGALSIEARGRAGLLDVIADALRSERTLLVLDNMEHLLAAGETVLALLHACPHLAILVTSREALRVRGERVYTLGPLPLPKREEDTARSPAVELFVERARDAGVPLELDEATGTLVVKLCGRLDGLPLAIELAAAWSPTLSLSALLDQLTSRFLTLDGGSRDAPLRQRTMYAAIAWSHHLLDDDERACFRRLAVFAGSCTLDAADTVCQAMEPLGTDTLCLLRSLTDKSLLSAANTMSDDREPRFRMLETIREFAHEQLVTMGERDSARREHAAYFLALAKRAEEAQNGPDQAIWLDRLEQDHDNLKVVLHYAERTGDLGLRLDLAAALWPFWWSRGHYDDARRWLGVLPAPAEMEAVSIEVRARLLNAAGELASTDGENGRSIALLRHALDLARRDGHDARTAKILRSLAAVEMAGGKFSLAQRLLDEALDLFQRLDDRAGICSALSALGGVARYQGRFDDAIVLYQRSRDMGRALGDEMHVAGMLARLGSLESERGRPWRATPLFDEAMTLYRQLGSTLGMGDILLRAGEAAAEAGQCEDAARLLEDSLRRFHAARNPYAVAYVLLFQGAVALHTGDLMRAEMLAGECVDFFRGAGDCRCLGDALLQQADVARERREYARARALYRESVALHRDANTRPLIARCLERLVVLDCREQQWERAARLHGTAAALRVEMGAEIPPVDRPRYQDCLATVKDRLGTAAFAWADAEGRDMCLEDVIVSVLGETIPADAAR